MNNFIVRTITGVLFVAVLVCSFLRPQAMVLLFALITGLTIWEFTGLVNERENVAVNRLISTVAGVYFLRILFPAWKPQEQLPVHDFQLNRQQPRASFPLL